MPTPTILTISPAAGHTGGKSFVEITGTNFRLPTQLPAVRGIVPEAKPSLRVMFGTAEATAVFVASPVLAYAVTPIADPTDAPVAVTVQNLDADGEPITGELATLAAAWRFMRPNFTDGDTDLVRLVRAFMDEIARQITPNVTWPQHTDYDEDTADTLSISEVPKLPGMIVAATDMVENRFYSVNEPQTSPNPNDPDGFEERAPPTTVDLVFTVVGVSDNAKELLNLSAVVKRFFKKNPYLSMARDPNDASKGRVQYEMDAQDAPDVKLSIASSDNNLHSFAIAARVRGFDIEGMLIDGGGDEAVLETGKTLEDGPALSIEPL